MPRYIRAFLEKPLSKVFWSQYIKRKWVGQIVKQGPSRHKVSTVQTEKVEVLKWRGKIEETEEWSGMILPGENQNPHNYIFWLHVHLNTVDEQYWWSSHTDPPSPFGLKSSHWIALSITISRTSHPSGQLQGPWSKKISCLNYCCYGSYGSRKFMMAHYYLGSSRLPALETCFSPALLFFPSAQIHPCSSPLWLNRNWFTPLLHVRIPVCPGLGSVYRKPSRLPGKDTEWAKKLISNQQRVWLTCSSII